MPSGGARNRSGPGKDPNSARSDRLGFKLLPLPSEGYQGEIPDFPLPGAKERELDVWSELWRTPQACAWITQPWRWLNVADLVRLEVRSEAHDSPVNLATVVRQARADLGLTPAGLKENGWAIVSDELAERRADRTSRPKSSRDRMKAAGGR